MGWKDAHVPGGKMMGFCIHEVKRCPCAWWKEAGFDGRVKHWLEKSLTFLSMGWKDAHVTGGKMSSLIGNVNVLV